VIGAVSEHVSPRGGLVVGGVACLVAAAIGMLAQARGDSRPEPGGAPA
jgi:hypothetical protein